MIALRAAVCLALLGGACAASQDATPISKVIDLIEGLKKEVEADGKTEGTAYDKFACFCKTTTAKKSKSVQKGNDKIGVLAADIGDKTQEQKDDSTELSKRQGDHQALNKKLDDTISRCAQEKAVYEAEAADLSKAIQGLKDAIKSMKTAQPSLLEIRATLGKTFEMAEAMNILSPQSTRPPQPSFRLLSTRVIRSTNLTQGTSLTFAMSSSLSTRTTRRHSMMSGPRLTRDASQ